MFTISNFFVSIFWQKNHQTCQTKKITTTKNNIDFYILKVILVYLKTYGSSSLDKLDYNIVFFLHKKN